MQIEIGGLVFFMSDNRIHQELMLDGNEVLKTWSYLRKRK